jgi:hypothetical protein
VFDNCGVMADGGLQIMVYGLQFAVYGLQFAIYGLQLQLQFMVYSVMVMAAEWCVKV